MLAVGIGQRDAHNGVSAVPLLNDNVRQSYVWVNVVLIDIITDISNS